METTNLTATGKLGGLVGHSISATNQVKPMSERTKKQQALNLERMRLEKHNRGEAYVLQGLMDFEENSMENRED